MSPSDRASISALVDDWLDGHPFRTFGRRKVNGMHYVTLKDERGNPTQTVSTDCWEDAARVILCGGGIAA